MDWTARLQAASNRPVRPKSVACCGPLLCKASHPDARFCMSHDSLFLIADGDSSVSNSLDSNLSGSIHWSAVPASSPKVSCSWCHVSSKRARTRCSQQGPIHHYSASGASGLTQNDKRVHTTGIHNDVIELTTSTCLSNIMRLQRG